MSNVSECLDLYVTDDAVTDAAFRAIMLDALARDAVDDAHTTGDGTLVRTILDRFEQLASVIEAAADAIEALDRMDDHRGLEIETLRRRLKVVEDLVR